MTKIIAVAALIAAVGAMPAVAAETGPNAAAIAKFAAFKGVWKGEMKGTRPDGGAFSFPFVERAGTMLGGDILLTQGTGYQPDGKVAFDALSVVSWNAQSNQYEFRGYTGGRAGTFVAAATDGGMTVTIPLPGGKIVSTIVVKDGTWHEVQQFVADGQPARTTAEFTLTRTGDTDWPAK